MATENDRASAVSALMDDELDLAEAQRTVDALLTDPQLRAQWRHSHALSDVLAGRQIVGANALAERVRTALDAEPAVLVPPRATPRRRAVPALGGFAIAASVAVAALLVVLGIQTLTPRDEPQQLAVAPSPEGPPSTPRTPAAGPAVPVRVGAESSASDLTRLTWNDPRPVVAERLNSYLLNHNQYQATGVQGMLPYARVVGYEPYD